MMSDNKDLGGEKVWGRSLFKGRRGLITIIQLKRGNFNTGEYRLGQKE